ncbi:LacI family DNA-binding transcriptional regulator [Treponema sp. OMZ 840]|uniref:LacI family DNA-binding transcriptional regulator n=1 Tax=Treponema sp. OMZ 840 TaxID=244313 RepID=UPI003D925C73
MSKITIKDVAAAAGVSVGTASMAINNSPRISAQTKHLVLDTVTRLNYRPNPYARSFSLSSSNTIGFLVPDLLNSFFGEMAGYLQKEVERRGKALMFGLTNESSKQEAKLTHQFIDRGIDGLIIVPVIENKPDLSHIYKLQEDNFPFVFISSYYKHISANCVMTDLYKGSYDLTLELLDSGHRYIILISGNPHLVPFAERIRGFIQAHKDRHIPFSENQIITTLSMSFQGGYDAIRKVYFARKIDAILAINDVMAMGIIGSLRACGVRIPEDVSVAGYDDISIAGLQETPLSTVHQPLDEMSRIAVDMLFRHIEGDTTITKPICLKPTLILRKSSTKE